MVGTRVFVGNLPLDSNERDLERFFKGYGRIREVLLKNGYGFVEFDDYRDAEDAIYELNGKKILGVRVTVERARGTPRGRDQFYGRGDRNEYRDTRRNDDYYNSNSSRQNRSDRYGPPTRTTHRLIVENLSSRCSWQDLKDYMRQAGEVTYADAHKKHRNEGVVEFASSSDMKNALEKLNNTEVNGRRIRLIEDKKGGRSRSSSYSSRSRSRSPRKSRSRSQSRSRSRSKSAANKKSKSRSKSPKKDNKERSRSRSRKSNERSVSRSKERRSGSRDKSNERSRSRSRSANGIKSHEGSRERSHSRENNKERSRSRSQD